MDATSSVAANALCTAMDVHSKEIVGDLNKRLSKSTKMVKEFKTNLKKQSRATVARGKACNHMMQEVMVKNVVQLLTVADMIRKAETKAECARWVSFLDRFDTEAGNYCQRYSKISRMSRNLRREVLDALVEGEDYAVEHFPDEFEPPCINMSDDRWKLCFDRFQIIKKSQDEGLLQMQCFRAVLQGD